MIGLKASDARSMVAAADAVQGMSDDAGHTGEIRLEAMLGAHHTLMKDDPMDGPHATRITTARVLSRRVSLVRVSYLA
jgi:hypothetical protein